MKLNIKPYAEDGFYQTKRAIMEAPSLEEAIRMLGKQRMDFELFVALVKRFPEAIKLIKDKSLRVRIARAVKAVGRYSDIKRHETFRRPVLDLAATDLLAALQQVPAEEGTGV